jgi:hypothetical protein
MDTAQVGWRDGCRLLWLDGALEAEGGPVTAVLVLEYVKRARPRQCMSVISLAHRLRQIGALPAGLYL